MDGTRGRYVRYFFALSRVTMYLCFPFFVCTKYSVVFSLSPSLPLHGMPMIIRERATQVRLRTCSIFTLHTTHLMFVVAFRTWKVVQGMTACDVSWGGVQITEQTFTSPYHGKASCARSEMMILGALRACVHLVFSHSICKAKNYPFSVPTHTASVQGLSVLEVLVC